MKNKIKKYTPKSILKFRLQLIKQKRMSEQIRNDKRRFDKHSFDTKTLNFNQMEARLTKEYHSIEKGLSYSNLRLGFGKQVLENVISLMKNYREQNFPLNTHVYRTALSTLYEYIRVHKENNYDVNDLEVIFKELEKDVKHSDTGGIKYENRVDILEKSKQNFKEFSMSRYSIREYSSEPVSFTTIEKALSLATQTPSACNRQPWKVRVVEDPKLKKFIQDNQNGNRGFGDFIDKYLIITADVSYYDKGRERNQANIDGGMYAMNLLYSLHFYGVASVPLSASLSLKQEANLRGKFKIPESENFIMFIGIGNYSDEFKVTKSDRREATYIKY